MSSGKNKQYIYGLHTVNAFLRKRPEQALDLFVASTRHDGRMKEILLLAKDAGLSVESCSDNRLNQLTQDAVHQGVVLLINAVEYQEHDLEHLLTEIKQPPLLLVLDCVQDPHNLGACLRVADAAGVDMVIIPKDRSTGLTPVVRKIASGAAETITIVQVTNLRRSLQIIKKQGIWLVGLTVTPQATSLYKTPLTGAIALVLGSEGAGLRPIIVNECDLTAYIPMQGEVESLNVSVAAGISLFEVVRQRG